MMITRGVKTRPSVFFFLSGLFMLLSFPPFFFSLFLDCCYTPFLLLPLGTDGERERPLVRSWTNNPVVFPLSGSKEIDETSFAGVFFSSAILLVFCSSFHFFILFCMYIQTYTYLVHIFVLGAKSSSVFPRVYIYSFFFIEFWLVRLFEGL